MSSFNPLIQEMESSCQPRIWAAVRKRNEPRSTRGSPAPQTPHVTATVREPGSGQAATAGTRARRGTFSLFPSPSEPYRMRRETGVPVCSQLAGPCFPGGGFGGPPASLVSANVAKTGDSLTAIFFPHLQECEKVAVKVELSR